MLNKKTIIEDMERLFALKDMVESYEEIAASRMRRVRDSVLRTRDFLSGINDIFHQVQSSYKNEIAMLMKKKKIKDSSKLTFLKRNGKTVFVLLSANTGLYGGIIKRTFNLFSENLKKGQDCDAIVIGKLGKSFYETEKIPNPVKFFELPDNKIDYEVFKQIMDQILEYEKIIVFHGLFQTVITQKPVMSDISGGEAKGENVQSSVQKEESPTKDQNVSKSSIKYLFEPSLEKIMGFFETEIFSSIFEQTLHESELAKFSSRMVVLDQAVDNIRNNIISTKNNYNRLRHSNGNRKQLGRLSGMSLWKLKL